jgi:hypothetical protein
MYVRTSSAPCSTLTLLDFTPLNMRDTSSPHAPRAGLPVQARLHQHQVLQPHDDHQDTPRRDRHGPVEIGGLDAGDDGCGVHCRESDDVEDWGAGRETRSELVGDGEGEMRSRRHWAMMTRRARAAGDGEVGDVTDMTRGS